jgi:hypothetical protein
MAEKLMVGPLVVNKVISRDKIFNLIQDTDLPAGTKQRGIAFFYNLKAGGFKEVVTYGTVYGYGQVATAWCCKEIGLLCKIFLPEKIPRTVMTKEAIRLGATIVDIKSNVGFVTTGALAIKAREYASEDMVNRKMIELGLDHPDYINALADGIAKESNGIRPNRIWVAGGSGVLSRAIAKAFPGVELLIVQVGRYIFPDVLAGIKHTIYVSPEPFKCNAQIPPPYTSLRHYDAKIWRFASIYGEDGDYIWNVK